MLVNPDDKDTTVLLQSQLVAYYSRILLSQFLLISSGSLAQVELVQNHTVVTTELRAKKPISKVFFSTAFINFYVLSGCVAEAISVQLIDAHG